MTDTVATRGLARPDFPWWVLLIQGIAAVIVGILLMTNTAMTTLVLVQIFGWFWLFQGIFELGSLFVDRTQWGWRVFSGLLGIVAGAFIIGSPFVGAAALVAASTLILGINGIIIGIVDLVRAFKGGGWGIGVIGALMLIIGVSITFNVVEYAIVLPWVWGLFAVIGGILGIVGSFQVKKLNG